MTFSPGTSKTLFHSKKNLPIRPFVSVRAMFRTIPLDTVTETHELFVIITIIVSIKTSPSLGDGAAGRGGSYKVRTHFHRHPQPVVYR